jgi:hypothetical protein
MNALRVIAYCKTLKGPVFDTKDRDSFPPPKIGKRAFKKSLCYCPFNLFCHHLLLTFIQKQNQTNLVSQLKIYILSPTVHQSAKVVSVKPDIFNNTHWCQKA